MNVNDDKKQQLTDHAAFILAISNEEQPVPVRWEEIKRSLRIHALIFSEIIIPEIEVKPRYSSNGGVAQYVPRPDAVNTEVTVDDSSASKPFLVGERPDKKE